MTSPSGHAGIKFNGTTTEDRPMTITPQEIEAWNAMKSHLAASFEVEEMDLFDSLDGELPLADKMREMIRFAIKMEAENHGLKKYIDELRVTHDARVEKVERIREAVLSAMEQIGTKKLESPDFVVSMKPGPRSVVVLDVGKLLPWHTKTKIEPDKAAIKADLEQGNPVEGAELSNGRPVLAIRRR